MFIAASEVSIQSISLRPRKLPMVQTPTPKSTPLPTEKGAAVGSYLRYWHQPRVLQKSKPGYIKEARVTRPARCCSASRASARLRSNQLNSTLVFPAPAKALTPTAYSARDRIERRALALPVSAALQKRSTARELWRQQSNKPAAESAIFVQA